MHGIASKKTTEDRRATFDELQQETCTYHAIIPAYYVNLKMEEVFAHWLPWDLMPEQKKMLVQKCCQPPVIHTGDSFYARFVTRQESWFHYRTPQKKRQLIQGKHDMTDTEVKNTHSYSTMSHACSWCRTTTTTHRFTLKLLNTLMICYIHTNIPCLL